MNELHGNPSLPPGVTLRDIDPWPNCVECGEDFEPDKAGEVLCQRCIRCNTSEDGYKDREFPLAGFKTASPAAFIIQPSPNPCSNKAGETADA